MARKFNPLAAYGTVTPPYNGAIHHQDGGYFDPAGNLLWEDHPATPPKVVKTEETVVTVEGDQSTIETRTVDTTVDQTEPGDPKDILSKWLKGEIKVNFQTVRAEVKKAFNVVPQTKADLIDYLVNTANLVPAELVKVS